MYISQSFASTLPSAHLLKTLKRITFPSSLSSTVLLMQCYCRWYCHFDDDVYVNIPNLESLLSEHDPIRDKVYLGRWPLAADHMKVDEKHFRKSFPDHVREREREIMICDVYIMSCRKESFIAMPLELLTALVLRS